MDSSEPIESAYGDLTRFNINGLLLSKVGKDRLVELVDFFQELLETSAAVYEKNGDYAIGLFSSAWCRLLDNASRYLLPRFIESILNVLCLLV